ncbi:MAG: hypothetical protein J7L45_01285 [Candidatus Aenigmarchaeota archaeon]|nr:hypothetical protein [Candidatus Aenigmarchaeota archaeon]
MKKGQNLILEQVFIFAIGVIIFIMVYFSFLSISNNIESVSRDDQMKEVGSYITSCIVKSCLGPEESRFAYKIPKDLSGKQYSGELGNGELNITVDENTFSFPINISCSIEGNFTSRTGMIEISKRNGKILVERI